MTPEQIEECRRELANLRRHPANIQRSDLENLALRMGYVLKPKKGGQPVYTKPGCWPVTIPSHGNKLNKFTVTGILDRLDEEIDRLEGAGNGN